MCYLHVVTGVKLFLSAIIFVLTIEGDATGIFGGAGGAGGAAFANGVFVFAEAGSEAGHRGGGPILPSASVVH